MSNERPSPADECFCRAQWNSFRRLGFAKFQSVFPECNGWPNSASVLVVFSVVDDIQYRCISSVIGGAMQVSKWGNSLAVRLPSEVVEALNLKEGDQIEIRIVDTREFEVRRDPARKRALDRLRRLRRPLPTGFVFDRAEANAR